MTQSTATVDTIQARCPICDSRRTRLFLGRPSVAVHQNLLFEDSESATEIARGRLEMRCCRECGFVFNAAFDESLMNYGASYDNTQNCSPAFSNYVEGLVDHLIDEEGVQNCRIVEVGCGKGEFLRRLVEAPNAGNTGIGFDPAYLGPLSDLEGRLTFQKTFYDEKAASERADVVVCRHVIEHVPIPLTLLSSVRQALSNSPEARVYFETPCVDWILDHKVIWDFFYEHCSLFTSASLRTAFESAGFAVRNVSHVFDQQYLWIEATVANEAVRPTIAPGSTPSLAEEFAATERELVDGWIQLARNLSASGGAVLWGAGAKGVTFANLVDPNRTLLDCIVDVNPAKQDKFLPGTGHPIIAPEELAARSVERALVLNPNYVAEIQQWLDERHINVRTINVMEPGDAKN